MDIAIASNAKYFHGLALALSSILHHGTGLDRARIHVLDSGLRPGQRRMLTQLVRRSHRDASLSFHDVADDTAGAARGLSGITSHYARLLLPDLLSDRDEVIYLDADVYCGLDIQAFHQIDITGVSVAAVKDKWLTCLRADCPWLDPDDPDADLPYFNSGVMKINLAYWRLHNIGARALQVARDEPGRCIYVDQTVLNYLLRGTVRWLPETFNTLDSYEHPTSYPDGRFDGRVIHYVSPRKPWLQYSTRATFRYWRRRYSELVSTWPGYGCRPLFWIPFFGRECLEGKAPQAPLYRLMLSTGMYHLIPGLTEPIMRQYLRDAVARRRSIVEGIPGSQDIPSV